MIAHPKIRHILYLICIAVYSHSFAQPKNLDYYISSAINSSPLIADYKNQMRSGSIDSALVKAEYLPQVSASSSAYYAPVINGYGYDQIITNIDQYNSLLNYDQLIFGGTNTENKYKGIGFERMSLENKTKLAEKDIRKDITAQYIIAYGDLQQLNYLKFVEDFLRKGEQVLYILTQKGVYRETDYITYLTTLNQQELQVVQQTVTYQNDIAQLNFLCGNVDTSFTELEDPGLKVTNDHDGLNSVFLKQYKLDSMILVNKSDDVDFSYRPKLSLHVDAGFNSTFQLTAYKNFGASVGLNFTYSLFDGNQRGLQKLKIGLEQQTNAKYKELFMKQYNQQIAQLQQQLSGAEQLIEQANDAIRNVEDLMYANQKLLAAGDMRVADLIIAINNYLAASNIARQNMINKYQIINQINYWISSN